MLQVDYRWSVARAMQYTNVRSVEPLLGIGSDRTTKVLCASPRAKLDLHLHQGSWSMPPPQLPVLCWSIYRSAETRSKIPLDCGVSCASAFHDVIGLARADGCNGVRQIPTRRAV